MIGRLRRWAATRRQPGERVRVPAPPPATLVLTGAQLMALREAVKLGGNVAVRFAVLMHDLGKGVTPAEILPSHHGHEDAGVALVEQLAARLRVPNHLRELAVLTARYHTHVHQASELRVKVIPFKEDVVKSAQRGLWMLMAAVCVLLAIASVNVALLMLARGRERDRELLIRIAIGAGRWRVVARLRCESGEDGSPNFITRKRALRILR